ncbi:hypothetical protein CKA32_006332 [Geitlerinema sp. FC II]|nr:hypothetical protein CKA32_006332 [Geitlerinema sp. FC II]
MGGHHPPAIAFPKRKTQVKVFENLLKAIAPDLTTKIDEIDADTKSESQH